MTDREMLELAAKAAGIQLVWHNFSNIPSLFKGLSSDEMWHPLTDDGDALRLAVKLRLEPRFLDNSHSNGAEPSRVTLHNVVGIVESIDGAQDLFAATRRAIVRAAAEIGRQMP